MSDSYARIFLLSHMRAFTSLAGHLLGSHPGINGYYELHIAYEEAAALDRQRDLLQASEGLKPGSRYLFDKLLHNDYGLKPERLGPVEMKILVALREPEQTIRSIVSLFAKKQTAELYASPVEAAGYYIGRLAALAEFCSAHSGRYCYFDADLLRDAPGVLLPRITRWLGLDTPLTESYDIFAGTGQARKGDSSGNIRSGCISRQVSDYSAIDLPQDQLEAARAAYDKARRQIIEHAADAVTA